MAGIALLALSNVQNVQAERWTVRGSEFTVRLPAKFSS
jgi:hypothetical protein